MTSINNKPDQLSIEDIHNQLLSYEYCLKQQNPDAQVTIPQANVTQISPTNQPQAFAPQVHVTNVNSFKRKLRGGPFNPNSHNSSISFQRSGFTIKHGQAGALGKPPSQSGRAHSFQGHCPTCQICGKQGHTALMCYHRVNPNYQAPKSFNVLSPSSTLFNAHGYHPSIATLLQNSPPSWYMDSGATHHFTPNTGILESAIPYFSTD